ncbi:MAG: GNAT family N-acetyltransferase [Candidatus Hodarchaeota archaeon]
MDIEILDVESYALNEREIKAIAEMETHPDVRKWELDDEHEDKSVDWYFEQFTEFFKSTPTDPDQYCLVLKVNGVIGGFLGVHRMVDTDPDSGEIGVVVHPDFQGHGLGTRLVAAGVELAEKKGFKIARMETSTGNERLIKIAKKLGFSEFQMSEKSVHFLKRFS